MRAQDQEPASTSRSQPRRTPTQTADPVPMSFHQAMPLTPQAVLHLQRTVGNATVARHLEAQRSESNDQPVQRSAVPDVLRSPGRPLDDDTRTEMEARLGADFSEVRLHTDTAAQRSATEIGAAAYPPATTWSWAKVAATGTPWRTNWSTSFSSARARWQVPDTGTGLRVSDPGDHFEREAEATAHRVLAGTPAHEHEHDHPHSHDAGPAPVQRKVTAQIVAADAAGEEELKVDRLITAGRPDSPHSGGTEGDHTTAYVVLTQAVRRVIKGQTAEGAAEGVWRLYQEAKKLPGEALRGNLDADKKHAALLNHAETELARLHELPDGKQWDIPRLQQLISAYLEYRGTLPLSTLNIKATGKPHGKGTGETSHVDPLNRFEAGDTTVPTAALKEAVRGLLDEGALMNYAINVEAPSGKVAPGTEDYETLDEEAFERRVRPVVEQHVASVAQAFPAAVEKAWGEPKKAEDDLAEELKGRWPDMRESQVTHYTDRLKQVREKGNTTLATHYENMLRHYGVEPPEAPKEELGRGARLKNKSKAFLSDIASSPKKLGKTIGSNAKKPDQQLDEATEQKANDAISREPEPGEARSRIATQLLIDESGRITEMRSAGRAASPFSGTMGAHTTAWIAHVDFIRARLVSKDVTAAVNELPGLVNHVAKVAQRLKPFTEDDGTGDITAGLAATHISEPAGGKAAATAEALQAIMDRLVKAATDAVDKPVGIQAVLLQQAVGAILERLNIIPGVTLDVAATEGSGEGTYRTILRTGRRGRTGKEVKKEKEYQDAVFGLLDMKASLSDEQRLALMQNHLAIIKEAYPGVLTKAGLKEDSPEKALTQWKKRGKDSEDSF